MFNMNQVGTNICRLRKSIGITQMELADRLGISFQAVSNWERGVSMPDIAKLNELSSLFNVSIDEILDNKRTSEIASKLLANQPIENVSIEEVEEIAPILHENEVDALLSYTDKKNVSVNDISSVAPFLSQEYIDKFAEELLSDYQSLHCIMPIAPFISTQIIDKKALEIFEQTEDLGKSSLCCTFPQQYSY